jgi:hypothetical protein
MHARHVCTRRLCFSPGNASLAVCGGGDVKQDEIYAALSNRTRLAQMVMAGTLVPFAGDPAHNATAPLANNCTPASLA